MEPTLTLVSDEALSAGIEIKDNRIRRNFVFVVFGAWAALTLAGVASGFWQLSLLQEIEATGMIDDTEQDRRYSDTEEVCRHASIPQEARKV